MRKANDLSHEEAVSIVGRIIDAMYLDADVESEFYDPDKSIDGADFVETAARYWPTMAWCPKKSNASFEA